MSLAQETVASANSGVSAGRSYGPWPECNDCQQAGTSACLRCSDGDQYEPSFIGRALVSTLLDQIKKGGR